VLPGEPTLERAGAGQVVAVGVLLPQVDQQVRSTPRGMLRVQQQRLLDYRGGGGRRTLPADRGHAAAAVDMETGTQGADGPRGQLQLAGDGGRAQATLLLREDAPPQRQGEGSRHTRSSS
jgi:hypothetical protein